ncbi:SRR [Branchiostoma lanceolatum]|uniref:L-serine ammonia-lyase n=1 Tax=Branchiostoma lanceolatum TaxID=7740 RepID=A0A8J9W218_BRALA|nr:SRR [Branchiostoma lanceolatum]
MEANDVVTLKTVQKAADTLSGHVIMTPVQTDETLDQLSGRRLFLKCENFQKSGSFKFRGAYNAVSRLVSSNGSTAHRLELVAGSTGNFACGLAMAAQLHGVTAHMVMPDNSPECKKQMALSHGASLTLCEPAAQDIARTVNQVRDATGAVFISGAERPDVISGHGTMGLELLRQSICPEIRVYGAEPEVSNCAAMSLKRGERYAFPRFPQSVADGLNGNIGKVPWTYIQRNVDDIFTVSEDEIKNAMRLMWERMQLVIEPSGAVGVAAVLSDSFKARAGGCKNVAVILSGRNVDIDKLSEIL